jgi:hypothetical protein
VSTDDEPVGTSRQERVEGGRIEVLKTAPGVIVASWLEDPGTQPAGVMWVPEKVAQQGTEAALKWAVREWNTKRLGKEAPKDPEPPHGDPLA